MPDPVAEFKAGLEALDASIKKLAETMAAAVAAIAAAPPGSNEFQIRHDDLMAAMAKPWPKTPEEGSSILARIAELRAEHDQRRSRTASLLSPQWPTQPSPPSAPPDGFDPPYNLQIASAYPMGTEIGDMLARLTMFSVRTGDARAARRDADAANLLAKVAGQRDEAIGQLDASHARVLVLEAALRRIEAGVWSSADVPDGNPTVSGVLKPGPWATIASTALAQPVDLPGQATTDGDSPWLPMADAPKDRRALFVDAQGYVCTGQWDRHAMHYAGAWIDDVEALIEPIGWMDLPGAIGTGSTL